MIDSDNIIQLCHRLNTLGPPCIIIFFHNIPAEQWIAPKLSICGKRIWRTSGNFYRIKILIQIELFWIRPDIRAVTCNINRNITNNFNSILVCICFQLSPLFKEQILQHFIKFNILSIINAGFIQCFRLANTQVFIPLFPCISIVGIFQCHK